jgi:hypothetical protein
MLLRFAVLLAAGLVITIATGVVCGRASQRWGPAPNMIAAAEHLKSLPASIGTWELADDQKMSDAVVETLQCAGYVNRRYIDRRTGSTVDLAIIVGPSGPVAVHTPEICYSSQAYSIEEPRQVKELVDSTGNRHKFWYTTFRSNNAIAEQLRVYYGWCADNRWQAAESPRFDFAGRPLLFKLQIASYVPPGHSETGKDPCELFLEKLLQSGWNVKG